MGNTIQNTNSKQINGNANMNSLYNKIGYLRKLNQPKKNQPGAVPQKGKNQPKSKPKNPPKKSKKLSKDDLKKDSVEEKISLAKQIIDNTLKFLMGIKNASINYSETNGTLMPGFMPSPVALGQDWNLMAPGTGFVFGSQKDIRQNAVTNGWLSKDTLLNTPFLTNQTKTLSARSTIEPIEGLKFELTANRNESHSKNEFFKADSSGHFASFSPMETGTFSISYINWNTAWKTENKTSHSSPNFEKFKANRLIIAKRLAAANPNWNGQMVDSTGFPSGYGATSQEVLIPAFLAAYTGKDAGVFGLNPFPKIPMPNWRITYDGLTKIPWVEKYFKTARLSHAYHSTYNVGSFVSNVRFQEDPYGNPTAKDILENFIAKDEINQISISEQFSPLISIDATMHNSIMIKLEIKKSRNLAMSFSNNQLTETTSNEYVIGSGYRIPDVEFAIKSGGKTHNLKSDLNLRADVSIRSNETVLRKLVENFDQISAGQRIISINLSADYMVTTNFMIRLFFDKIITNPFVSSVFPNANTNAGFSFRFTLAS